MPERLQVGSYVITDDGEWWWKSVVAGASGG